MKNHIKPLYCLGTPVLPATYGESLSYMEVQGKMQYTINQMIENQEDFDERLETSEGDIDALEERMDTAEGDIDALEDRMGTAEDEIDALEGRMDTAESDIDALEGRMDTAEGDIDALEGRMDTAEGDIDALEGRMDTAEGDIDALEGGMPRNYPVVIDSISVADGESKVVGYVDLHTGVDRVSSLFTCTLNYEVRVTGGSSFGTVTADIRLDGDSIGEFEFTYFNGGMHNECMIVPVDMLYVGNHIVDVVVSADDCTLA